MSYDGSWTPPADDPPDPPPRERSPYDRPAFTQPPFVQLPPAAPAPSGDEWPARRDESQGPYGQRDQGWQDDRARGGGYGAGRPGGSGEPMWPRGQGAWDDPLADPQRPGRLVAGERRAPLDERSAPRHGGSPRRGRARLAAAGLVVVGVAAVVAVRQSGGGDADPAAGGGRWEAERFGDSQMLASDGEQVCSVTSDSLVYCLDPATGDEVFSRQLYMSVVTSPALADGGVLVGGSSSGSAGTVFAYTADGEDLWEAPVDITSDRPLLVVGGVVVLVAGDGRDGALVGLDLATGAERWRIYDAAAGGTAQLISPRVFTDGARLYVALAEGAGEASLGTGYIVAVDPASGQEIWRSADIAGIGISRSVASAAPFSDGSAAAFALEASPSAGEEGGRVVVLDSATGAVRWEVPTATSAGVVHVDGLIVTLDGGDLRAYDAAGDEAWSTSLPVSDDAPGEPAVTSLVLDGERLFGIGRGVYAIDPATGELGVVVDNGTTSDVAVAGDSLVVASVFSVSAVPLEDVPFGEQQVTVVTG